MKTCRLSLLIWMTLSLMAAATAQQSVADAAREARAERANAPHSRVLTNEDIEAPKPAFEDKDAEGKDGEAKPGVAKAASEAAKADPAKQREDESRKRTEEIEKRYRDRVKGAQDKIAAAQTEIGRLERDRIESANQFRQSVGGSPSAMEFEQQQKTLAEQIQSQRERITSLQSELEDAREAARHAGVKLE